MQPIKREDAEIFKNSPACTATEYAFTDEDAINVAGIELSGRYPEKGYALNTISKELVYVTKGNGKLITASQNVTLKTGDVALIEPNEKYYFDGMLKLVISSSPAWRPEQYQNILE
jgi:mannose-6-phosphate isomerase class I